MAKRFFTYLLLFEGGYLYTGSTGTPHRRLRQHGQGRAKVIWRQSFPDREAAVLREQQIKGWSRGKKLALAQGDLPQLKALSKRRAGHPAYQDPEKPLAPAQS